MIWDLSSFQILELSSINFLDAVLVESHKFWYVFIFIQFRILCIFPIDFLDSWIFFFRSVLFCLQVLRLFYLLLIISNLIQLYSEYALYGLNLFYVPECGLPW